MIRQLVNARSGVKWLRRAEKLARDSERRGGTKREIIQGYILEGVALGRLLKARVIDLPIQILIFGRGPAKQFNTDDSTINTAFSYPIALYNRDDLGPQHADEPPELIGPTAYLLPRVLATLYSSGGGPAPFYAAYHHFSHGMHPVGGGSYSAGESRGRGYPAGGSTLLITGYTNAAYPQVYQFMFDLIRPNTLKIGVSSGFSFRAKQALGLSLDSGWISAHIGGGMQVVPTYPTNAFPNFNLGLWNRDSSGKRFLIPWAYGSVRSITPVDSGEVAVWRVCTRAGTPPASDIDFYGLRMLFVFDVQTIAVEGVGSQAQPAPVSAAYDPTSSGDINRRPLFISDGDGDRYDLNSFCAPATCPNGAMVIGHVVRRGVELDERYFSVLLTTGGSFVELVLPESAERRVTLFAGGETVGGVTYALNPYLQFGQMAVVDASTGAITLVACPVWNAPIEYPPLGDSVSTFYAEDHMRNLISHMGLGKLIFPVADSTGQTVSMGVYDTTTGEATQAGVMWTADRQAMWGGVARIAVVQQAIAATDTAEEKPAVLLGGYASGPTASGANIGGMVVISYDSGVTWTPISTQYGPARGLAVLGNGLFYPPAGELWSAQ